MFLNLVLDEFCRPTRLKHLRKYILFACDGFLLEHINFLPRQQTLFLSLRDNLDSQMELVDLMLCQLGLFPIRYLIVQLNRILLQP
jgi:hypothetical protein